MRMTAAGIGSVLLMGAIAGCAPQPGPTGARAAPPATVATTPAGGPFITGTSTASMAGQYERPILGPTPAAGASAWVRPAPAPAFVDSTPLPPAAPPPPPPAAVANRQPAPPSGSVPPSEVVRPEAAAADAPDPAPGAGADLAAGRRLFVDYACGTCHTLADAGGTGGIGPSLDRNPRLTQALAADVIANGSGAMPAFGGQLSESEIETLAAYVVHAARD